jgi:choline dehydrogenase-like flavoprotein
MTDSGVDVVIVGAGIAGGSLGAVLARAGLEVLILERSTEHRDRVRGEYMHPWGVAEAQRMSLYDALIGAGANVLGRLVPYDETRTERGLRALCTGARRAHASTSLFFRRHHHPVDRFRSWQPGAPPRRRRTPRERSRVVHDPSRGFLRARTRTTRSVRRSHQGTPLRAGLSHEHTRTLSQNPRPRTTGHDRLTTPGLGRSRSYECGLVRVVERPGARRLAELGQRCDPDSEWI